MDSKNILIAATMALIGGLILGDLINGNQYLVGLVAASPLYDLVHLALFGLLGSLLIWDPPRSIRFRSLLAAGSAASLVGALLIVASFSVNVLDALLLVQASIMFAIEALELQPQAMEDGRPVSN